MSIILVNYHVSILFAWRTITLALMAWIFGLGSLRIFSDSYKFSKENSRCLLSKLNLWGNFANSVDFYCSGLFVGLLLPLTFGFLAFENDMFAQHDFIFCGSVLEYVLWDLYRLATLWLGFVDSRAARYRMVVKFSMTRSMSRFVFRGVELAKWELIYFKYFKEFVNLFIRASGSLPLERCLNMCIMTREWSGKSW